MSRDSAGWRLRTATALQGALAIVVLCTLAFAPPAHGRTLLIPIDGKPISRSVLDRATLFPIAAGPLPGSIVVDGPGRGLAAGLFKDGIIMLAAPVGLCSERMNAEGAE